MVGDPITYKSIIHTLDLLRTYRCGVLRIGDDQRRIRSPDLGFDAHEEEGCWRITCTTTGRTWVVHTERELLWALCFCTIGSLEEILKERPPSQERKEPR